VEWITSLKKAIAYIESHLLDEIDGYEVAEQVHISPLYFQKGFSLLTGYSITEYIRYRRLYLSALDIRNSSAKVIDTAYKYGYETPESFTKAFTRFHGVSPLTLKSDRTKIKPFLPLKISIEITGGSNMDYKVEKMKSFKVIGYKRLFSFDNSYEKIPEFWNEFCTNCSTGKNSKEVQDVIEKCIIGEYGICIDNNPSSKQFTYMIAGNYDGGAIPEGMSLYEIPEAQWAKFRCIGPLPGALQSVNTEIFKSWLPGNPEWEMSDSMNIEWYSVLDGNSSNYESGIWIPVKHK
jgi:AraC family transcriptional regulator